MPSSGAKRARDATQLEAILCCCGSPKLSMGWFHLTQLLEREDVRVSSVIEPYFLGAGAGTAAAKSFNELREAHPSIDFCASMDDVAKKADATASRLVLIAGRTCDAPDLFAAAIDKGATHIYLEKPGAETAKTLMKMREQAKRHGVAVIVGYNKNVAKYSCAALDSLTDPKEDTGALPSVTLEHCNDFAPGKGLVEFMRGPGGEGMLHNMCCHELALAATRFGVSCDRIRSVSLLRDRSELLDLGEDGRADWSKVAFKVLLEPAAKEAPPPAAGCVRLDELTFSADRCGGNFSRVLLSSGPGGEEEAAATAATRAFRLPDAEHEAWIERAQAEDPLIRPYFLQQAPDYETLKGVFIEHILNDKPGVPNGVVGLDGAIEALRLADLLKPALLECWKTQRAWTPSS